MFPIGGGECGELIRATDWSGSSVGAIEHWPRLLATTVQTLLESRHPMFLWWGPELIQFYNDAYRPSFGEGKHPLAMGQRGRDCWAEIWPIIGPQIERVMSHGESTFHEDALVPIYRNGRIEEVYWTYGYSPVRDDTGRTAGTLVVCTETTSRVLATRRQQLAGRLLQEASPLDAASQVLQRACTSLADFAEDVPFAIAVDRSGAVTASASIVADHPAAQALARSVNRDATGAFALPLAIAVGPWPEPVTRGFAAPLADGGALVFGLSARLPFDNDYRSFLLRLADSISALAERNAALAIRAAGEQERRDLLLQAPVATALLTGPDHVFELANARYVAMVGRPVVGKAYIEAFPELRDTPLPEILRGVYERGVPFVTDELLVPLDGAPRYFKFNLEPLRGVDGRVFGMMAIAIDITAIVAARDDSATLVAELTAASRAKDEFLAMLGHELRNPLSPIVTALDLVAAKGNDPFEREHRVIRGQTAHLIRLVDDLLDVSKITRGKVVLKKELTTIGAVIARAVQIASSLIDERRHRLVVERPGEDVAWVGDPTRMAQVIANLLTNAARYTQPGGDIRVAVHSDGDEVEIVVSDNGTGITTELLPTIFDLFVQGPRDFDRAQGGLGIGLALVKNLVALHGGSVGAASPGAGGGSTFTVRLPLADTIATRTPAVAPEPARAAVGRKVLVVDDNVDAADLLGEVLRVRGHEVEVVHDPLAAIEVFARFQPDVALLDLGLPVMDGYELAGRLRDAAGAACRLVAVTGYGQQSDRDRTVAAGFAAHLVKPIQLDALLTAIG